VIGLGLHQIQDELNIKADAIQHEFIALSNEIDEVGKDILEAQGDERKPLREKQAAMRTKQQKLAEEINLWRERARKVRSRSGREELRTFLNELLTLGDKTVNPAVERTIYLLDTPEDARGNIEEKFEPIRMSEAGRLIERGRTDYTLRVSDPAARQREAIRFANRPGIALDEGNIAELEAAMEDPDPIVRELAILTTIQFYRFRTNRMADLDAAHHSAQFLARLKHAAVIPTLIEVLENRRTGFIQENGEPVESDNGRSRMVVLLRLVEWNTAEAKIALQGMKFDSDPHIVRAAARALELFPGPWTGSLKGSPGKGV